MAEAIRLVIWDLDETFWRGTLTEGGIAFLPENLEIVAALARRGIISAVCSKNDLEAARAALSEHGAWEWFVFPSVDWSPKGRRIAAQIAEIGLRPESVLFIDDNPMNLAEAAHHAPGLQTADHGIIPGLLADPRLAGKDDRDLTRLAQYRVLEAKRTDAQAAGGDDEAFLRASGIRVAIDHDVEAQIDRAVELINRTNQLNFTKRRLPEDAQAARDEPRAVLARYDVNAGLVSVRDRYGEYGVVGFFLVTGHRAEGWVQHFCFSCRTLGMGIETWVWRRLGRPSLHVAGPVLNDVTIDARDVEAWIKPAGIEEGAAAAEAPWDRIVLRGGCDLGAMSHYLGPLAKSLHPEFHTVRDDRQIRIDSLSCLPWALEAPDAATQAALLRVGHVREEWESALQLPQGRTVWLLSFWVDSFAMIYRHRTLGFHVTFCLPGAPHAHDDVTALDPADVAPRLRTPAQRSTYAALLEEFEAVGRVDEAMARDAIRRLLRSAAADTRIFLILGPETFARSQGDVSPRREEIALNGWIRAEAEGCPNVTLLPIDRFAQPDRPRSGDLHFDRLTYRQAADAVIRDLRAAGLPGS